MRGEGVGGGVGGGVGDKSGVSLIFVGNEIRMAGCQAVSLSALQADRPRADRLSVVRDLSQLSDTIVHID